MKEKRQMMMVRQGDVLLMPTDRDGDALAPADPRGLVLAEGESSGHYHAVTGRGHKLFALKGSSDRLLVIGKAGAEVEVVGGGAGGVPRHHPISLDPGCYRVRVQKAWTSAHRARRVED